MKTHLPVAIVLFLSGVASMSTAIGGQSSAAGLKDLAGTWREVSRERDGQMLSDRLTETTFDERGSVTTRLGGQVGYQGTVKIDRESSPKTIDFTQTSESGPPGNKGETRLGIYEINGDTLRICLARAAAERPDRFSAPAGSNLVLSVYRREMK